MKEYIYRPAKRKDYVGQRFSRLVVIKEITPHIYIDKKGRKNSRRKMMCKCDCGNIIETKLVYLTNKDTKSCGCLKPESVIKAHTTHGLTYKISEYHIWILMKRRCNNPTPDEKKSYQDRGIKVCDRWVHSFENFLSDMGRRPSLKHSLDRINNDGNYEPENCRWATNKQQSVNKTNSMVFMFDGVKYSSVELAIKAGLSYRTFLSRIRYGWSLEKILNTPIKKYK